MKVNTIKDQKTKRNIVYAILACVVVFVILRLIFSGNEKVSGAISVTVSPVVQKSVDVKYQAVGTVQAYSSVEIKSMVTGPLVRAGFREGDLVEEGQVLFEIDNRQYADVLQQAKANLARDQATLANNEMLVKRNTPLVKKGYVDKQSYETLVANAKAMAATVQAAEAAVKNAELNLNYATIRAPIAGKTGNITLKPGSIIKANDTLTLVTIKQINPIYVVFSIPQKDLPLVQEGIRRGPVQVKAFITPTQFEVGTLTFIDNTVDTTTGTIQVKATFENKDRRLWPGQYVTAEISLEKLHQAILVPSLAVLTAQKGFYVYIVENDAIARLRYVTPGPVVDHETIINSGLRPGEKVVTAGVLRLNDGATVRIVK